MKKDLFVALQSGAFSKDHLIRALSVKGKEQQKLFALARKRRSQCFPSEEVEARSVIELSNICTQNCKFCNINLRSPLERYIIGYDELVLRAGYLYRKTRRVLLLQSGELRSQNYIDFIATSVRHIKRKFPDMTIILCLGNLSDRQYRQLRKAGAERYILKFETSNTSLYKKIKPGDTLENRVRCIRALKRIGFAVGTGNIIGMPGQTIEDIANDLLFTGKFELAMASASVFIPGEQSAYRNKPTGDVNTTLNYMALMRILYPKLLIPSTSSLEKAKKNVQYRGLMAGANTVTIHDGTPARLKKFFPIYSTKRVTPNATYIKRIVRKAGLKLRREGYDA